MMEMYLTDKFMGFETDEDLYEKISSYFISNSKDIVHIDDKTFYNYYPNDGYSLQFIVKTTTDKKKKQIDIENLCIHHNSCDVWNLKIGPKTRSKDTYMVSTDNDDRVAVIRLANHDDAKKYKDGAKIKAQVVGFVLSGNIYENEEAYEKGVENHEVTRVDDDCMIPLHLLVNNNPKKPKSEKNAVLPDEDRIMTVKFKIKSCHKFPLHLFECDMPTYYAVGVETAYGHMYLFFNMDLLDKPVAQFKKGDIIAGNVMLSGDIHLNEDNTNYHAETKTELTSIVDRLGMIGRTIKDIDTAGVVDDISPKKKQMSKGKFGFSTDLPIRLELNGGQSLNIYANSFKDVYEGFDITVNPKPSNHERDNDLNVADYCKECLGKKIIGYEITEFGEDTPDDIQNITPESPKTLIIKLEDGTRMIFGHWLMAEYMDFLVELPKK